MLVLADIIIVIVDLATEAQSEKVNKIPVKNLKNLADFMTFVYMELVIIMANKKESVCDWFSLS